VREIERRATPMRQTPAQGPGVETGKPSLGARAAEELRRFIVLFLYLWVILGLFVLNEHVVLGQRGVSFSVAQGFAVINALIMAKVMLLADIADIGRIMNRRPLIERVVFDSALFSIIFIVFHIAEEVVVGLFKGKSVAESLPSIGGGGFLGPLCVAAILFFTLMPFFAFRWLDRSLGPGRMRSLLLTPPNNLRL
jgi:hypothetical protein